ncbi:MAG: ABC transporter transmembrane domain-containing protein [Alphaproteobacteria bacterium]
MTDDKKAADTPTSLRTLKLFWPYIRPYRRGVIAASCALLLVSFALLSLGRGFAFLVDNGLGDRNPDVLDLSVLAVVGLAALLGLGSFLRMSLLNHVAENVMADIRRSVFAHTLSLPLSWFETARTGDILSRLTTDISVVQTVLATTLSMATRSFILLIGGTVLVVLSSPKMSLVVAIIVPLIVVPLILLARRLRAASRIAQDRLADMGVQAEENISAIRTIHAFSREMMALGRFSSSLDESLSAALIRVRLRSLLAGFIMFMIITGIAAILWIGGRDLLAGQISAGDLSSFIFYAFLVASSAGTLSELGGDLQRAAGAADRIAQLLSVPAQVADPSAPRSLPHADRVTIICDRLSFSYAAQQGRVALHEISFTASPGQKIAIVGPSGAGKSTLFHLILRFYEPSSGSISLNNIDVTSMTRRDVRNHIGLVPQDPALFSSTVLDNIAFGQPEASRAEIEAAARQAQAHDFICQLPHGYDTPVGEKGVRLSGGQKQRLAIARAILRDPAILLLDEATSALDSVSEAAIQTALLSLMEGRTSLVIAHRLSTIIDADIILLMDKGSIVASGTHDALLASSPLYQQLALHQFT